MDEVDACRVVDVVPSGAEVELHSSPDDAHHDGSHLDDERVVTSMHSCVHHGYSHTKSVRIAPVHDHTVDHR